MYVAAATVGGRSDPYLERLQNAVVTSTHAVGAIDEATLLALLRRAKGGYSSASFLSVLLFAFAIAVVQLPFWEVTSSTASLDLTFSLPATVRACPLDTSSSTSCQRSSFSDSSMFSAASVNMSAVSIVTFVLIIFSMIPTLMTSAQSSLLARRINMLLGINSMGGTLGGVMLPGSVANSLGPLSHRAARSPRLPLRLSAINSVCLGVATIMYGITCTQFVSSAFSRATYGSVGSNPSIGFILLCCAAFMSLMNTASLGRSAKILAVIEMTMPSFAISFAPGAGGGAALTVAAMNGGYMPVPTGAPQMQPAAAPGVPMAMPYPQSYPQQPYPQPYPQQPMLAQPQQQPAYATAVSPDQATAGGQYYPQPQYPADGGYTAPPPQGVKTV